MAEKWLINRWGFPVMEEAKKNPDFVFKDGFAFPRYMSCGNYTTPHESRYAYGPHVIKGPVQKFEDDQYVADYDDRLRGFYPERWEEACKMLTGRFSNASLLSLSKFLSHLYGKPVKCVQVIEGCNVSNGYPYWVFVSEKLAARQESAS